MKPEKIEQTITRLGSSIKMAVSPKGKEQHLEYNVLKSSRNSAVLKISVGRTTAVGKLFSDTKPARKMFRRERRALDVLNGAQIPKLKLVAEKDLFVLSEFIEGRPLTDVLSENSLPRTAEHVGQWLGNLESAAPHKDSDDNWYGYLKNYEKGLNFEALDKQRALLKNSPVGRLTLAHNDNAMSNYILGTDKRLYGIDFESAQMKPVGWDLITATLAMMRKFPNAISDIINAKMRGYNLTAPNSVLPKDFEQIISVVSVSHLVSDV